MCCDCDEDKTLKLISVLYNWWILVFLSFTAVVWWRKPKSWELFTKEFETESEWMNCLEKLKKNNLIVKTLFDKHDWGITLDVFISSCVPTFRKRQEIALSGTILFQFIFRNCSVSGTWSLMPSLWLFLFLVLSQLIIPISVDLAWRLKLSYFGYSHPLSGTLALQVCVSIRNAASA